MLIYKSVLDAFLIPSGINSVTDTLTATLDAVRQASVPSDLDSAVAVGK